MNRLACLIFSAILVLATGCSSYTHLGLSIDRHTFRSTPLRPVSLKLVEEASGKPLWMLDVPVNKMVVVQMNHTKTFIESGYGKVPPIGISWNIFAPDDDFGYLANNMPLPGTPVKLVYTHREDPDALYHNGPIDDVYREGTDAPVVRQFEPVAAPEKPAGPTKPATPSTPAKPIAAPDKPVEAPEKPVVAPDKPEEPKIKPPMVPISEPKPMPKPPEAAPKPPEAAPKPPEAPKGNLGATDGRKDG